MTLAQLNNLLLQDVQPALQAQLYTKTVLMDWLKRGMTTYRKLQNGHFEIRVKQGSHAGIYPAGRSQTSIPTGVPSFNTMTVDAKYGYGSHVLDDKDLQAAEGDPGAIANLATLIGQSAMEDMRRDLNRQWLQAGDCILGKTSGTGSSVTTVTVGTYRRSFRPTEYLAKGMQLLIGTAAQIVAGTADAVTVLEVISDTQFTTTAAFTYAASDLIVKANAYDATGAVYTEQMGLAGLIDAAGGNTTTFQGLTRTAYAWVNAYIDSAAVTLAEADMIAAALSADGDLAFGLTTKELFAKFGTILATNKRYQTLELDGGFQGLQLAAGNRPIPIIMDRDVLPGEMYFVDPSSFEVGEHAPLSWMDRGEGVLKHVSGTSGYQAIARLYGQLMCKHPRANAALRAKTVT